LNNDFKDLISNVNKINCMIKISYENIVGYKINL